MMMNDHWTTAVLTHNAYKDSEKRAIADMVAERLKKQLNSQSKPRAARRYYSYREAADVLGCTYSKIYTAAERGQLKMVRPGNKRPILRRDLEEWSGTEIT